MLKIMLHGCSGKMGRMVEEIVNTREDCCIIVGVGEETSECNKEYPIYNNAKAVKERADVIIDFSHASAIDDLLEYAKSTNIPLVLCTTGLSDESIKKVEDYVREIPIFKSANMSLGINVIERILSQISAILYNADFDIEVVEKHHNQKVDAPSGTALMLADAIKKHINELEYKYDRHLDTEKREKTEIGIHAIRGGTIPGEHSVIFAGNDEIIEIKHTALSRKILAEGAIKAAQFISDKNKGLYSMKDIL